MEPGPLRRSAARVALGAALGVVLGVALTLSPLAAGAEDEHPALDPAQLQAADRAGEAAAVELQGSPAQVQVRCSEDRGVEVCIRRRAAVTDSVVTDSVVTEGAVTHAAEMPRPLLSGAVTSQPVERVPGACTGTGSDGHRVQVVYAHASATPDPQAVAAITASLGNVEAAFVASAARTGGSRALRWVTDHGSPGCRVMLRSARITSGLDDFDSLMADLESQGAVPALGVGTTKHLVYTDGSIDDPPSNTCGLAESFGDDRPRGSVSSNLNLAGTRGAVDPRCWDLNGGGSVPAHEVMHTLGAVQASAPHAANDGHCNDEYDLMCYGPNMTYPCASVADDALFDCGNDDYFNTDPLAGQYLCDHWNTAESSYLQGWDSTQPPRAVLNLSATSAPGSLVVAHGGTPSCHGADYYRVTVAGVVTRDTSALSTSFGLPGGTYTVTVWPHSPYGNVFGPPRSVGVTVPPRPNRSPVGGMVLSLTDGRGYGMLGWAVDPDTAGPTRMRVVIPGVAVREYDWNYWWDDMPVFTGWNRHESLLFLAQLPPGTHRVCLDARDARSGAWTRLECRTHTVK